MSNVTEIILRKNRNGVDVDVLIRTTDGLGGMGSDYIYLGTVKKDEKIDLKHTTCLKLNQDEGYKGEDIEPGLDHGETGEKD